MKMFIFRRMAQISKLLVVLGVMLSTGLFSSYAIADDSGDDTHAIITSRFILWDSSEKMIDPFFNIHVFDLNITANHSSNYDIWVGEIHEFDSFENYHVIHFNMTGIDEISKITVDINNITIMVALDIDVIGGMSENRVKQPYNPLTIDLSPFELSELEWNIFWGILGASILALIFAYRRVKNYRIYRGVKEWGKR